MNNESNKFLAWFLGPKSENAKYFEELLNTILRDYLHWRKNYFPEDDLLITKSVQRDGHFEKEIDNIQHYVYKMMGDLKRNFPFYSPRYMAHMLSDITMPSMLGYFAGMLFNANNVTSEASPVAAEWEIQASNSLIDMLGYTMSPKPPDKKDYSKYEKDSKYWKKFYKEMREEYAWGHITSGGTIANIEALWVARNVRYLSLGILEAYSLIILEKYEPKELGGKIILRKEGISEFKNIKFNLWETDIAYKKEVEYNILCIEPNNAINLLGIFYNSFEFTSDEPKLGKSSVEKKKAAGLHLLSKTVYYNDLPKLLHDYPPLIFAPYTAHYSILKAADILGIPRNNVIKVSTDIHFRMDISNLKTKIETHTKERKKIPLVVIGVLGTTEEGSVDSLHKILKLREELKKTNKITYWIHADAAYGGFFSCLLKINDLKLLEFIKNKVVSYLSDLFYDEESSLGEEEKNDDYEKLKKIIKQDTEINTKLATLYRWHIISKSGREEWKKLKIILERINEIEVKKKDKDEQQEALKAIQEIEKKIAAFTNVTRKYKSTLEETKIEYLKSEIQSKSKHIEKKTNDKQGEISFDWADDDVIKAFQAIKDVESVTVDPHKMGYVQYPCGFIAFKNDKIRNFIKQGAPYITSSHSNELNHQPIRHIESLNTEHLKKGYPPCKEEEYKVAIEAFASFILEGSKPAAAASSLWLTTHVIKPDLHHFGQIIINTILSANELYWRIRNNNEFREVQTSEKESIKYKIVTLIDKIPDTNVIVFYILPHSTNSNIIRLETINNATNHVYQQFHISAEHGDRKTSYSQEFFVSKTKMSSESYDVDSLAYHCSPNKPFCYKEFKDDYIKYGLEVIRMSVMNPYVYPYKTLNGLNLIEMFLKEIDKAMKSFKLSNESNSAIKAIK